MDYKHGDNWAIWEFRAEGTGYPDSEVYNRIEHYPWPDHHPPPFALIPSIVASIRNWLKGPESKDGRVAVVHCKAGKGRSGTVATSYLISEEDWSVEEAMQRFTERRMRSGFGPGLSIPSQIRWLKYVDWWAKHDKIYVERAIEVVEIHVWGLRDGVKVAVEGYVDKGKLIKCFHTFSREERMIMDQSDSDLPESTLDTPIADKKSLPLRQTMSAPAEPDSSSDISTKLPKSNTSDVTGAAAALFRPNAKVVVPTSDVNIDFERRNKAKYGLTMVTAVAHVWFNAYFESLCSEPKSNADQPNGSVSQSTQPSDPKNPPSSGVFSIEWDAMDGIKGSSRKGKRAFDRISVVWRAASSTEPSTSTTETNVKVTPPKLITEPRPGEPVEQTGPANADASSRLLSPDAPKLAKNLGLRIESPQSTDISRSSSPVSTDVEGVSDDVAEKGIQPFFSGGKNKSQDANDAAPVEDGSVVDKKNGADTHSQEDHQKQSQQDSASAKQSKG